jgi:uncharacterized protein (TIGR02145 family)
VSEANLTALNATVAATTAENANTLAEIQALLSTATAAIATISAWADSAGINSITPSVENYIHAGITGVDNNSVILVNATVAAAGVGAADTTVKIQVLVDDMVSLSNSTMTASVTSISAGSGDSSTITLQAKNGDGSNLTSGGLAVTMSVNTGSSATLGGVTDNNNGTYTATLTEGGTVETVTISAKIGDELVAATATVNFIANAMTSGGIDYDIVAIGEQVWTSESMRHSSSYGQTWSADNNSSNDAVYGKLYDWYALMKGSDAEGAQGLCASGWHIPSDDDWKQLEGALGMSEEEQDKMSVLRGTDQGKQLRKGGSSGFEAMSAGIAYPDFAPKEFDESDNFANSTTYFIDMGDGTFNADSAYQRRLYTAKTEVERNRTSKTYGFSVRCVKN